MVKLQGKYRRKVSIFGEKFVEVLALKKKKTFSDFF